jgi:hypothetical protein
MVVRPSLREAAAAHERRDVHSRQVQFTDRLAHGAAALGQHDGVNALSDRRVLVEGRPIAAHELLE